MNVVIDAKNKVSINNVCVGKMDWQPRDWYEVMMWVIKKYLSESTVKYLQPRIGNRRTPNLTCFSICGSVIEHDVKPLDRFSPIVEFLMIALEFVKEFEKKPDTLWLILNHVDKQNINVERKISILNPGLKNFVLERQQSFGLSFDDFHNVVLPCFKAIVRDLMGVGKS